MAYLLGVAERQLLAPDLLIGFMTFTCNQHQIILIGHAHCLGNCLSAVVNHLPATSLSETSRNVADNPFRLLGTRVVVGYDDVIRPLFRFFRHFRPLAGVPVATATEHTDQPAPDVGPQCFKRIGQGIGGVSIVHHHMFAG